MDRSVFDNMDAIEKKHWWFVARREIIKTTIRRLIQLPENPKILEAGCGTGGNLELLSQFGVLNAFEYDERAREIASKKSGLDVSAGYLPDNVPFSDQSFDLICLFDVLEHVDEDVETLAALKHCLSPDGRILLTVPAYPWLWSEHDEIHHHKRRYTKNMLKEVTQQAGLRIESKYSFNGLLFPLVLGIRAAKKLFGIKSPDDGLPSSFANKVLRGIFSAERHLVGRLPMPVGLSICAVLVPEAK